jgi:hypothetical protein
MQTQLSKILKYPVYNEFVNEIVLAVHNVAKTFLAFGIMLFAFCFCLLCFAQFGYFAICYMYFIDV